jgi:AsmA protein
MKKSLVKKALIIVGAVIALLVVIAIAIPLFVDVNKYKPTLETDLSTALGRKVELGNIGLSILSGGVKVDDVSIADDPAFSQTPFLQAKEVTAGVALLPLIFSGRLAVSSFTVTDPQVSLLRSASGKWNFSSLGGASKGSQSESSGATDISVAELKISNATLILGTAGAHGKTQTYQGVNIEASSLSYTSQFPFKFSAQTPGGGTISLEGQAGPMNASDSAQTPLDAKLEVKSLDLAKTGFFDPSSGLAGIVDFTGALTSDGREMKSNGTVNVNKVKLVAGGSPSSVPVNVDYATTYEVESQKGTLTQGDVHIGKALAALTGTYDTAGTTTTVQLKLNGQAMPAPDLEGVLPAVGITLPSGASLKSGTLNANLAISGPVDRLTIVGPVNLSNGEMTGFNLTSKLGALGSFAGLGKGGGSNTEIQTFSADLHQDPAGTQANNVNIVVPSIGTITGTANVSPAGKLDCKMNAKLAAGNMVGSLTSGLSSFTGGGKSSSSSGIPFKIEGTTKDPIFIPDVAGMATGMLKGGAGTAMGAAGAASGMLGGLFGKKKN